MYGYVMKDHYSLDLSVSKEEREERKVGRRKERKSKEERWEEGREKQREGNILNHDIKGQNTGQIHTPPQFGSTHFETS